MADLTQIELPNGSTYDFKDALGRKEAYLEWGGKNFSGSYGCIDAAMVSDLNANRFSFLKAAGITIEYTRDGGTTWTDYGATDAQKVGLFNPGQGFAIGKADSTNKATANGTKYQLRVTINTSSASIYTGLTKIIIYCSTNGSAESKCQIFGTLKPSTDYTAITNPIGISGWSGYNVIQVNFTAGNSFDGQYNNVRFLFTANGGNTTYTGLVISQILGFGGVGWTTPSTMAKNGHLYSYDSSQNAVFPASVTASSITASNIAMPLSAGKITGLTAGTTQIFKDGIGISNPTTANDVGWIRVTGTGESDTTLELATGDDGGTGEQIVVRQYNTSNVVAREAKLLDTSGNTTFPNNVTATKFIGALQGNADTATSATTATSSTNTSNLLQNTRMEYGWNGVNYFNMAGTAGSGVKVNDVPTSTWWHIMRFNHANSTGYYTDLAVPFNANSLYYKRIHAGALQNSGWVKVYDELNLTSGTAASGGTALSLCTTGEKYTWNNMLPLAGGTMSGTVTFNNVTNAISYTGTKATYPMIKFKDNTNDSYGNGIVIGGGGLVVVGGGESADSVAATHTSGGDEVLDLCSDGAVYIWTNVQSGATSTDVKKFTFDTAGSLTATKFIGPLQGNADTATKLGTSTVGGTTTPIYLNAGTPTALAYTIAKSVPASAIFTDTYVNRTDSTANSALRVLLTTEADDTNTTGTARKSSKLTFNPSTGNLQATQLNGVAIGTDPKFTDHTYNFGGTTFYSGNQTNAEHNCNSATYNGHYYYTSNGPATTEGASTTDGALFVQAYSTSWVGQIAQDYRNGKLQVRGLNNGTWYPWLPVMTFEDTFGLLYTATKFKFNGLTRKIQANKSTSAWDSQVYSSQGYASNCFVTFKPSQTNMAIMIGLDANPTEDANYTKIDYCWYIQNDGKLNIYESGSPKLTAYAYAVGDDLRIEYDGVSIRYLHNGVIKRTIARAISGKLYMDSSFHGASGAVYDFDFGVAPYNTTNASLANTVYGIYTGSGGAQGPSYFGKNTAGFLMSNATVSGDSHYKNWLYMDNYSGGDVGGATAIGVDRMEPRLFIMQSDANRTSWNNTAACGVFTATPTSGQVVITDGTTGGIKSSGYTIAKSVPSDAVFTDTTYSFVDGTNGFSVNVSGGAATRVKVTPSFDVTDVSSSIAKISTNTTTLDAFGYKWGRIVYLYILNLVTAKACQNAEQYANGLPVPNRDVTVSLSSATTGYTYRMRIDSGGNLREWYNNAPIPSGMTLFGVITYISAS